MHDLRRRARLLEGARAVERERHLEGRREEATPHIKLARSLRPRTTDGDELE